MTIVILSSFSLGNLSKGQLLELAEMSWGIREFKLYQHKRYNHLFTVLNIDRNTTNPKIIEEIKNYAYCTESFNAFLYELSKLTNEEYAEIISFYQTDVGKKLNQAYIGFHPKILNKIYKKSENKTKISKEKTLLIMLIFKELNLINLQAYYEVDRLMTEKLFDKKNPKYIDKSIIKYADNTRSIVKKNIKEYGMVFFKYFTINELEKVLKYAKNKGGKRELDVFYRGLKEAYFYQLSCPTVVCQEGVTTNDN
ncbi:MAG: Unknown protein [uncultured Sulfurovum sp.]|uniref:Uncharacterized protein n=1 Tax=uncultured Sulfurovum sp. TaxID=269237 RepID=A0A6S6S749_9BACT|nr:MAG: Unknown protein [uncultured Sulfurovum sp.]